MGNDLAEVADYVGVGGWREQMIRLVDYGIRARRVVDVGGSHR